MPLRSGAILETTAGNVPSLTGTPADGTSFSVVSLAEVPDIIPTLAEWLYHQWGHLQPDDSVSRRVQALQERLDVGRIPFTLAAVRGHTPLGCASVVEHDIPGRPDLSPCVASVFVHPSYRKQGVGSALMERVTTQAFRLGYERLYLFTWDQERLYRSLGWETMETAPYRGDRIVIMRRFRT
ncbi:MAG: N-acetyltransferase [Candidatus Neomarinimicrobiota bacterium]|nr:MAG: N-acetyltransferase [Candidatus Neomarinimicrobiota bacterium]